LTDKKQFATIDDYISSFPPDVQDILQRVRQTIHKAAPQASETISYNMPTFDLNGEHLVFFAGWKDYVSLYPLRSPNRLQADKRETKYNNRAI
jgi:uncharacterized protein YdhG (YjbR/CyaY superfamily)